MNLGHDLCLNCGLTRKEINTENLQRIAFNEFEYERRKGWGHFEPLLNCKRGFAQKDGSTKWVEYEDHLFQS